MKKIFFFEGESPTLIFEERANFVGSMIRTKENANVPRPSIYVLLRPISFMQHIIMIALRNFYSHTRFIHPSMHPSIHSRERETEGERERERQRERQRETETETETETLFEMLKCLLKIFKISVQNLTLS